MLEYNNVKIMNHIRQIPAKGEKSLWENRGTDFWISCQSATHLPSKNVRERR